MVAPPELPRPAIERRDEIPRLPERGRHVPGAAGGDHPVLRRVSLPVLSQAEQGREGSHVSHLCKLLAVELL